MSTDEKLEECLLLLTDGGFVYDFDSTESSDSKHSITLFSPTGEYICYGHSRKTVFKGAIEYIVQKY